MIRALSKLAFLELACPKWGRLGNEPFPAPGDLNTFKIRVISSSSDALISKRVYKKPFYHKKAKDIIVLGKGSSFDADIVDCFLIRESAFQEISKAY
jgi:hypothetical protein